MFSLGENTRQKCLRIKSDKSYKPTTNFPALGKCDKQASSLEPTVLSNMMPGMCLIIENSSRKGQWFRISRTDT